MYPWKETVTTVINICSKQLAHNSPSRIDVLWELHLFLDFKIKMKPFYNFFFKKVASLSTPSDKLILSTGHCLSCKYSCIKKLHRWPLTVASFHLFITCFLPNRYSSDNPPFSHLSSQEPIGDQSPEGFIPVLQGLQDRYILPDLRLQILFFHLWLPLFVVQLSFSWMSLGTI